MKVICQLLVAALMLGFSSGVLAQNSIKLLAPGVGWAMRGGRLYWTKDDGATWRDITPPAHSHLADIFFLNPSFGWVTVNVAEDKDWPKTESYLFATTDSGATWSRNTIPVADKDYGSSGSSSGVAGDVAFVDSIHGWTSLTFGSGAFVGGVLLATSDGGRTWSNLHNSPEVARAEILLRDSNEGWLFGDGGGNMDCVKCLYVTRDGGHSWKEVAPDVPGSMYSEVRGLPTFEDAKHGFLEVTGPHHVGDNLRSTLVLFKTSDAGRTWRSDRTVTNLDEISERQYSSSAVVDSDWVFVAAFDHVPVLKKIGVGASIDAISNTAGSLLKYKEISQMSLATPTQGWVLVDDGDLESTTDGGATWTNITPGLKP